MIYSLPLPDKYGHNDSHGQRHGYNDSKECLLNATTPDSIIGHILIYPYIIGVGYLKAGIRIGTTKVHTINNIVTLVVKVSSQCL